MQFTLPFVDNFVLSDDGDDGDGSFDDDFDKIGNSVSFIYPIGSAMTLLSLRFFEFYVVLHLTSFGVSFLHYHETSRLV